MRFFSWLVGKKNFEKQLEEQDRKIRQNQSQKLKYTLRTKSVPSLLWKLYLAIACLVCSTIFILVQPPRSYYAMGVTLFLCYILNFLTSKLIVWYYATYSNSVETSIEQLVIDQRELLEEFKQQHNFIHTQDVVMKYERVLRYFERKILNFTEDMYRDELIVAKEKKQLCDQETQTPEELLPKIKVYVPKSPAPYQDNTEKSEREKQLEEVIHRLKVELTRQQQHSRVPLAASQEALSPSKLYNAKEIARHYVPPTSPQTPTRNSLPSDHDMFPLSSDNDHVVVQTPIKPKTGWFDKVLDKIIGQSPENCVALICAKCYSHNGLQMVEDAHNGYNFKCWKCKKLNVKLSEQQRRMLQESENSLLEEVEEQAMLAQSTPTKKVDSSVQHDEIDNDAATIQE